MFYLLLPELVKYFSASHDIRVKLFNLLSQMLLHNLPSLKKLADFDTFLASYLNFVGKYFSTNHDQSVLGSLRDILRNTLMVASAEGLLSSPQVWTEASMLIDSHCAELKQCLQAGKPPPAHVVQTHAGDSISRQMAEAAASKLAAEQDAAEARMEAEAARRTLQEMQLRQQKFAQQQTTAAIAQPLTISADDAVLHRMKVSELQKLARAEGIDEETIDDTMEEERPKDALVGLIASHRIEPSMAHVVTTV